VFAAFVLPVEPNSQARHRQIRLTLERAARIPMKIAEATSGIAIEL
jgi:formiminotetrahydrofolate cyclodeaminase